MPGSLWSAGAGNVRTERTTLNTPIKTVWFLLLVVSLLLVCLPRFNQRDWGPIGKLTGGNLSMGMGGDSARYITYVYYLRGNARFDDLRVPFAYRPLVPLLASLLPFEAMTAINIINFLSLLIAAILLYHLLYFIGFSFYYAILGSFIFIVSFPTFYYGTVGCVDPVLILFLTMGLCFLFKKKWAYLILTVVLGLLVKETIVILIPVSVTFLILNHEPWKLKSAMLLIIYLGTMLVLRFVFRDLAGTNYLQVSFRSFLSNLRVRALLSTVLTFGIPGLLSLSLLLRYSVVFKGVDKPMPLSLLFPLVEGVLLSVALSFYSMFSAHTDGRFIWPSYPFSIPLSLWALEHLKSRRKGYV